jgi:chromosomal replication initiator protein
MWLARKHTRSALSEIGDYFGRRSHATVISANKRVNGWVTSGDHLQLANHTCHVEDAIRRVEQRMRTA